MLIQFICQILLFGKELTAVLETKTVVEQNELKQELILVCSCLSGTRKTL
jgi:uncharacterized BrkB/YihY/UPF0761 family membrane protein